MSQHLPTIALGSQRSSRIGLGMMGLSGTWDPSGVTDAALERATAAVRAAVDAGITLFDHADIYGSQTCEQVFRTCLAHLPRGREGLIIATKCGINITREPYQYNLSEAYIRASLEGSLRRIGLEYVDLYQVHRHDPLTHPRETARALDKLVEEGLVRAVGVSNYLPEHVRALQAYMHTALASTQPAFSLWELAPLHDGTLDQAVALGLRPLAYSPLGAGYLAGKQLGADHPRFAVWQKLHVTLQQLADKHEATPRQVALAWLLAHPAGIVPLVGSVSPDHIREAVGAVTVRLSRDDWYRLWTAAREVPLP